MPVIISKKLQHHADQSSSDDKPGEVIKFPAATLNEAIELTEDAVAEAFAQDFGDKMRFDHMQCKWFIWDGVRWKRNDTEAAYDYARRLCRKHRRHQRIMGSRKAAEGVEHMARRDQRLAVTSDNWDQDPYLLGTPGGTVELKTGKLRAANREDFLTKCAAVTPADQGAECPIFNKFFADATGGDKALQRFLQQWAGYCLTGDTSEQALLFIYGPGGNGKGVFLNILTDIMASTDTAGYAKTAAMDTFVALKHPRHLAELAMLHGARLVTSSETEKDQIWSESRINQLTGEDPITANFMRQDHFSFRPRFKLTFIGNHKPKLGTVNDAARRRFNIVPFMHKPDVPDKGLIKKLRTEYPVILRWMLDGCLDWQKNGLIRPPIVTTTTDQYFEEQDLVGRWIDEKCECGLGMKETASNLFASYKEFSIANGELPGTQTVFGSLLQQRDGLERKKSSGIQYVGIKLKPEEALKLKFGPYASATF